MQNRNRINEVQRHQNNSDRLIQNRTDALTQNRKIMARLLSVCLLCVGMLGATNNVYALMCAVNADSWNTGYVVNVTVTNDTNATINEWKVKLNHNQNPALTGFWNATTSVSGNTVNVSNTSWNGSLAPNQSASFGYQGNISGNFELPLCDADSTNPSSTPTPTIPTSAPTNAPTLAPTATPTLIPTSVPTPTLAPTNTPTPTDPPSGGDLVLQENMKGFCHVDGVIENNNSGFTGSGYANTENANGRTIGWRVNVEFAGSYQLDWRYANGSSENRTGVVSVNEVAEGNINFPTTGAWTSWTVDSAVVSLTSGLNDIVLTASTDVGLANIDALTFIGSGITALDCNDFSTTPTPTATPTVTPTPEVTSAPTAIPTPTATPTTTSTPTPTPTTEPTSLPPAESELVGWAAMPECGANGTTGGGSATPITVTDTASLKAAMNSSDPQVIYVSGRIKTPGNFSGRKNKTLIGINNAEIYGGSGLVVANNIIVKNIKFSDGSNDSFGLSGSTCIWIDHCEFVDGSDGNLDIVNGTDLVTISWSKFYYTRGHGHMLATLVGNSQPLDADVGKERITFHHNWWGAGVKSRKPRVRYGQVHLFNNYYHYTPVSGDTGDNYDIGAGFQSKLIVENNYFDGSNTPITWMSDEGTAEVVQRNNAFVNAGSAVSRGTAFTPPYRYDHLMEPADSVKPSVTAGAGVQ